MRRFHRLVQATSSGSLYVVLPKKWVKCKGLKKGSKVELVDMGRSLCLAPAEPPPPPRWRLEPREDSVGRALCMVLCGYAAGYPRLEILAPWDGGLEELRRAKERIRIDGVASRITRSVVVQRGPEGGVLAVSYREPAGDDEGALAVAMEGLASALDSSGASGGEALDAIEETVLASIRRISKTLGIGAAAELYLLGLLTAVAGLMATLPDWPGDGARRLLQDSLRRLVTGEPCLILEELEALLPEEPPAGYLRRWVRLALCLLSCPSYDCRDAT